MAESGAGRPLFQDEMRALEDAALGALDMVGGQLDRVLDAVARVDLALAEFIVADDDRIDGRYLEVHQGVLSLLALQGPVAGDLRVVAAVLHVINAVERMGDQCVNIAKLLPLPSYRPPPDNVLVERILQMGKVVREEVASARRAFTDRDLELARSLAKRNRESEHLNLEIFRLAVQAGEDPEQREWAMTTTLVARALERISNNASEIAEQAIFVETGHLSEAVAPAVRRGS